MSEMISRQKSFISVTKLINGLNINSEESDGSHFIRISFDQFLKTKNDKMCVRLLTVKEIKNNAVIKIYDMLDIFEIAGGINVWLDVGHQMNKETMSYTRKELNCIDIDTKLSSFITNHGERIQFHKLTYRPVVRSEVSIKKMNNYVKELEQKEQEHINKHLEKFNEDDI